MVYNIRITDPAPSMNESRTVVEGNYNDIVSEMENMWKSYNPQRSMCLCSGRYGLYWYHSIDTKGVSVDRNTGSGVPAEKNIGK
jgi:hypothetical protein